MKGTIKCPRGQSGRTGHTDQICPQDLTDPTIQAETVDSSHQIQTPKMGTQILTNPQALPTSPISIDPQTLHIDPPTNPPEDHTDLPARPAGDRWNLYGRKATVIL